MGGMEGIEEERSEQQSDRAENHYQNGLDLGRFEVQKVMFHIRKSDDENTKTAEKRATGCTRSSRSIHWKAHLIDFASRFPPRQLEASRLRGFEALRL